jgi:hypothetical protein
MYLTDKSLGQIDIMGLALPGYSSLLSPQQSAPMAQPTYACPNGIFTNYPTAPLYDARFQQQKDAYHPSGIYPGEACPPEMEGGKVVRGQPSSFFYAKSGNVYITTDKYGWSPCPKWPTPLVTSGSLPELIYGARVWVDQASPVIAWAADVFGPYEGGKLFECPGYPKEADAGFYGKIASKMGIGYAPFMDYIWRLIFPEGGAQTLTHGWMNTRGAYQAPIRPNPEMITTRAGYLDTLVKAWDSPPWPHGWFKSFITAPLVAVPPFYNGYKINDAAISESDYFPRDVDQIKKDLAKYIHDNEKLLNDHFYAEAQRWLDNEEAKMRAAIKRQKTLGIIAMVLDVFTFGAASALLAIAKISMTRDLLNTQKNNIKLMTSNFGVTDEALNKFSMWIVHYLGAAPLKVPETNPNEAPSGRYSIYIEQKPIKYSNTSDDALRIAFASSTTGERILIKDGNTGEAVGYFIRESNALKKAPASIAGKLQAMSPETAKSMVAGGGGIPIWLAAVPIALKVMKVI